MTNESLVRLIHGRQMNSHVHVLETLVPILLQLLEGFGERGKEAMLVLRERFDVRPKVKIGKESFARPSRTLRREVCARGAQSSYPRVEEPRI